MMSYPKWVASAQNAGPDYANANCTLTNGDLYKGPIFLIRYSYSNCNAQRGCYAHDSFWHGVGQQSKESICNGE